MQIAKTSLIITLNQGETHHADIVLPIRMIIDHTIVKALRIYRSWPLTCVDGIYEFDLFSAQPILGLPRNKLSVHERRWLSIHINNNWLIPPDVAPIDHFIHIIERKSINKSITEIGNIVDGAFEILPEPVIGYSFKYTEISYIVNYEHCINSAR